MSRQCVVFFTQVAFAAAVLGLAIAKLIAPHTPAEETIYMSLVMVVVGIYIRREPPIARQKSTR